MDTQGKLTKREALNALRLVFAKHEIEVIYGYLGYDSAELSELREILQKTKNEVEALSDDENALKGYVYHFCVQYIIPHEQPFSSQQLLWMLNSQIELLDEEILNTIRLEIDLQELENVSTSKRSLNQPEIGLLYYYRSCNGGKFEIPEWSQVAKEYGYPNKTSGNKISQYYYEFQRSKVNRINKPSAAERISKVINYLAEYPKAKKRAEDELKEANEWINNRETRRGNK